MFSGVTRGPADGPFVQESFGMWHKTTAVSVFPTCATRSGFVPQHKELADNSRNGESQAEERERRLT
ncbi:hypothetical protein AOLI_G00231630 [Acnodon oligacanthus]